MVEVDRKATTYDVRSMYTKRGEIQAVVLVPSSNHDRLIFVIKVLYNI